MLLSPRFLEALATACRLHAGQERKLSRTPYVAHLLRVAGIVLEAGGTEDEAIAALLHDAIEDQGGAAAREAILLQFGAEVVGIVDQCSDTDQTPKPPWRDRKECFLARLPEASASALLVTAADKLDNVHALIEGHHAHGERLWNSFRGGREGTLWYYRAVADAIRRAAPSPLADRLDRAMTHLESLADGHTP